MEEQEYHDEHWPIVALIGALLLVAGVASFFGELSKLWLTITDWSAVNYPHATAHLAFFSLPYERTLSYFQNIGHLILGIGGITCGVGLLRRAPWARRWSMAVLIGLAAFPFLSYIMQYIFRLPYSVAPTKYMIRLSQTGALVTDKVAHAHVVNFEYLHLPYYLILFLSLAAPGVLGYVEARNEPTALARFSEKLLGYLPRAVPPVISLIALLLITSSLTSIYVLVSMARPLSQHLFEVIGFDYASYGMFIAPSIIIIVSLIGGISALLRTKWAWHILFGTLIVLCVTGFVSALWSSSLRFQFLFGPLFSTLAMPIHALFGGFGLYFVMALYCKWHPYTVS